MNITRVILLLKYDIYSEIWVISVGTAFGMH